MSEEKAFRSAIGMIGLTLPDEYVYVGDYTIEGGSAGTEHLLETSRPPTAIVCSNDMITIGGIACGIPIGLKIPEDVSLIGFDDIGIAKFMLPPLMTVRMSGREIAISAVRTLIASLKNDSLTRAEYGLVKTRLVVRGNRHPFRKEVSQAFLRKDL